jgi:DNA-binding IclR family transcriptional regulator
MAPAFVAIGERTGLCRALDRIGPATPAELAQRSGFSEGYVGEWLSGLLADGYVSRDSEGRYRLVEVPEW